MTTLISRAAGSVDLAWNASTNSGIAGYNIYYGTTSHGYVNEVAAGTNLTAAVTGLPTGHTYYFAVTAVDSFGNESDFSNEISYSLAAVNQPPTISAIATQATYTGRPITVSFTVNDPDTGPNGLTLSAVSSNAGLVPSGNIVFGGSGANRTATVTPLAGQTGSAQITITVSDGSLTAQSSFTLSVTQPVAMQTADVGRSTFNGLFYESSAVRVQSAGALKLTVSPGGKYSGQLMMAAGKSSFSGQFGTFCEATNAVARKGATPLSVYFTLKSVGTSEQLTGTVSDGTWTAQVYGQAAMFSSKTNPAPYAGSYTMEIPGQANPPAFSVGNGYASLKIDGNGNVRLMGALADNTKISASAPIAPDGTWPLFVPLYRGQGLLIGWISFTNRTTDDLHGPVNWIKLPTAGGLVCPQGLTYEGNALGSVFSPTGTEPLVFGSAQLELGAAGSGLLMSLKISPGTGVFSAQMLNRTTGKPVKFQGALLQKLNAGYGFVVVTNQSTPAVITP